MEIPMNQLTSAALNTADPSGVLLLRLSESEKQVPAKAFQTCLPACFSLIHNLTPEQEAKVFMTKNIFDILKEKGTESYSAREIPQEAYTVPANINTAYNEQSEHIVSKAKALADVEGLIVNEPNRPVKDQQADSVFIRFKTPNIIMQDKLITYFTEIPEQKNNVPPNPQSDKSNSQNDSTMLINEPLKSKTLNLESGILESSEVKSKYEGLPFQPDKSLSKQETENQQVNVPEQILGKETSEEQPSFNFPHLTVQQQTPKSMQINNQKQGSNEESMANNQRSNLNHIQQGIDTVGKEETVESKIRPNTLDTDHSAPLASAQAGYRSISAPSTPEILLEEITYQRATAEKNNPAPQGLVSPLEKHIEPQITSYTTEMGLPKNNLVNQLQKENNNDTQASPVPSTPDTLSLALTKDKDISSDVTASEVKENTKPYQTIIATPSTYNIKSQDTALPSLLVRHIPTQVKYKSVSSSTTPEILAEEITYQQSTTEKNNPAPQGMVSPLEKHIEQQNTSYTNPLSASDESPLTTMSKPKPLMTGLLEIDLLNLLQKENNKDIQPSPARPVPDTLTPTLHKDMDMAGEINTKLSLLNRVRQEIHTIEPKVTVKGVTNQHVVASNDKVEVTDVITNEVKDNTKFSKTIIAPINTNNIKPQDATHLYPFTQHTPAPVEYRIISARSTPEIIIEEISYQRATAEKNNPAPQGMVSPLEKHIEQQNTSNTNPISTSDESPLTAMSKPKPLMTGLLEIDLLNSLKKENNKDIQPKPVPTTQDTLSLVLPKDKNTPSETNSNLSLLNQLQRQILATQPTITVKDDKQVIQASFSPNQYAAPSNDTLEVIDIIKNMAIEKNIYKTKGFVESKSVELGFSPPTTLSQKNMNNITPQSLPSQTVDKQIVIHQDLPTEHSSVKESAKNIQIQKSDIQLNVNKSNTGSNNTTSGESHTWRHIVVQNPLVESMDPKTHTNTQTTGQTISEPEPRATLFSVSTESRAKGTASDLSSQPADARQTDVTLAEGERKANPSNSIFSPQEIKAVDLSPLKTKPTINEQQNNLPINLITGEKNASIIASSHEELARQSVKDVPKMNNSQQVPEPSYNNIMEQIAQKARLCLREGRWDMNLRLDPPELGHIKLKFSVTGNRLEASIEVEKLNVMHAIEKDIPRLRESISSVGVDVGKLVVLCHEKNDGHHRPYFTEHTDPATQNSTEEDTTSDTVEKVDQGLALTGINNALDVGRIDYIA